MTALVEALWTAEPTTNFRQRKRLSRSSHNRRKPLYQAVFATLSSRRTARTAALNCINLGKIIDPACGCGNFMIVTYEELRKLELEILKVYRGGTRQLVLDISSLVKVNVGQFYGIECEDFPCQIAQVGMWLMDHKMNNLVSDEFGKYYARLPITQSATIIHGNALRIDWESVVPKEELRYILGNPPFVGASMMSAEQKAEAVAIFGKIKLSNSIDYVGAWYHKAAQYIQDTQIHVAFVSTNSITQGEQVAPLWGKMFDTYGVHIDFGYRTFK